MLCEAVQKVQTGFARLKMRVASDDYPGVAEELLGSYESDSEQPPMPSELGRFAEVNWE